MSKYLSEDNFVGVVGAGTMGQGIAQIASTYRHQVFLYDAYSDQLGNAKHSLRKILQRQVEKDRMTQEEVDGIMERIHFEDDLTKFNQCEIVIEAVIEDLEIKQDVFQRLEGIVSRDCILATNTSSLSIAAISSVLKKPKRFLGIHFFNPAPIMPLVEIVPGISTTEKTVNTARTLIDNWDKTTVLAKDTPGFIVNRVARPFYGEAIRQLEEGVADIPTIDWAMKEIGKFKMGPFKLMDFIGNDINYKVTETVFEEFFYDPRFKPSFTQKRMVEAGYLGKKSGKGFYDYGDNAENPEPTKDKDLGQEIVDRILAMLINEAADAVFMNVATVEDVDLAMTKGVNYPKGLLKWGDEIGLVNVLDRLTSLQTEYREDRYRPNPLLKQKVRNGETFY
ncbi:3-hydroxyacyl-CoA dehydrogenase NAD-binding domain-containing protein [Aliifodinibius salicampi]|uniref:3-hydroxyacyl-CoA dehydrogenase NAD-binding domain-containing protein n=1 Tax=Fodinibius salicampi TaxID=1920655 RepID=A0ABT3PTW6_9BACT|nr:3-hydroxyacyl-CoA dehydrogenase NAD-binding domain-containing protein [Fodinibius salicampi]MCW9711287.1 3-hydroxyacyl-CoA dehydrogenase NAD-binding domain-containing protein [Fodinibius salicampi]